SNHSDAVVTVDGSGNVVALGHTINTIDQWGSTGIFVGGVSIPDAACFQQRLMAKVGAGGRILVTMNPLVVLKEGMPLLSCSALGTGLYEVTLQRLHNVLDFQMDLKAAIETPIFHGPMWASDPAGRPQYHMQAVRKDDFPDDLLQVVRDRGQPIALLEHDDRYQSRGYWIGVSIDPQSGERWGGGCQEFNGYPLSE